MGRFPAHSAEEKVSARSFDNIDEVVRETPVRALEEELESMNYSDGFESCSWYFPWL